MKQNELMIGGWVYYKDKEQMPCRVISISRNSIRFNNGTPQDWMSDVKNFTPIPLTAEILEKIGFVRFYVNYEENIVIMILKEFSDWQKEGLGYKKISQDDSRDEQIIKGIYNALKYLELENSWDILCDEPYVDILDAYDWLEKQGEKKSTDKAEPKFKVGDWITDGYVGGLITSIEDNYPCYKIADFMGGINTSIPLTLQDNYHLWTIEDAKDGDVLCYKDEISLYKHNIINCTKQETAFGGFVYYCCYDGKRFITDSLYSLTEQDKIDIHPATKEQRDLLFEKMKEAGYKWDSVKKKLKKIEVASKEGKDEREELILYLKGIFNDIANDKWDGTLFTLSSGNYVSLIKKADDVRNYSHELLHIADQILKDRGVEYTENNEALAYMVGWLNEQYSYVLDELKPKWHPTKEQMTELAHLISGCSCNVEVVQELHKQLEEL